MTKNSVKSTLKSIGAGTLAVGEALLDAPARMRIREIDEEITKLQEERAKLESGLIHKI